MSKSNDDYIVCTVPEDMKNIACFNLGAAMARNDRKKILELRAEILSWNTMADGSSPEEFLRGVGL